MSGGKGKAPPSAILGAAADGAPFAVDVGELVGGHLAVIANSGSGKSRSVRKLLEATHGRIQHIVLDDEGEFYTLRERFDYVIVGGENGDCPLSVASAEPLALALLENGLSAIIQTGTLDTEDGQSFVSAFLDALRKAPQSLWHPVVVVIDEAQRFAPNGELVASSRAVAEFAASARKRGYTLVVATGRFSMLSPKVRAHCVNWLIGRAGLDLDSRAAAAALGFRPTSPEAQGLKGLARGAFWAFGPALAASAALMQFGDVATTHLQRGQAPVPTPPAPRKLARILAALSAAAAPPKATPADRPGPGSSSGEVREAASPDEIAAAEQRGYERGLEEGLRRGGVYAVRIVSGLDEALEPVLGLLQRHRDEAETGRWALTRRARELEQQRVTEAARGALAAEPDRPTLKQPGERGEAAAPDHAGSESDVVSPASGRILDAIAWLSATGQDEPTREIVAFLSRVSPRSSGFRNNLGALRSAGLVAYPRSGAVALTEMGVGRASAPVEALTHDALMARIAAVIEPARMRVLRVACDLYPESGNRTDIANMAGVSPTSSGFRNNLGGLSSLGLVTYPGPGEVRAADLLFPERRP